MLQLYVAEMKENNYFSKENSPIAALKICSGFIFVIWSPVFKTIDTFLNRSCENLEFRALAIRTVS